MKNRLVLKLEEKELRRDILEYVIFSCTQQTGIAEGLDLQDLPATSTRDKKSGIVLVKRYILESGKRVETEESSNKLNNEEILKVVAWSRYFLGMIEMEINIIQAEIYKDSKDHCQ